MSYVWESRSEGNIICTMNQNYKGYQNKDAEPEWIARWEQFALRHQNLCRSHYTNDKEFVYFELDAGVKET